MKHCVSHYFPIRTIFAAIVLSLPSATALAQRAETPASEPPSATNQPARAPDQSIVTTGNTSANDHRPTEPRSQLVYEDMPWIEDTPLAIRQRAHAIYLEGNVLFRDTLFASAARKYQQAIALWGEPGFYYNLALVRIHLDDPIGALAAMEMALRYGKAPLGEELYASAERIRTLLDSQLAEITVSCAEPGATVTFDGKPILTGPAAITFRALSGGHMLMATKAGHLPDANEIVLAPGERRALSLAPKLPDRMVKVRRWPAWQPWAVVGLGAAMLSTAAVIDWRAGGIFANSGRDFAFHCTAENGCPRDNIPAAFFATEERATWHRTLATSIYAAGGVVAMAGAVLVYSNREQTVRRSHVAGGPIAAGPFAVVPALGPTTLGLRAWARF